MHSQGVVMEGDTKMAFKRLLDTHMDMKGIEEYGSDIVGRRVCSCTALFYVLNYYSESK